jgi:hypothetical protein
MDIDCICLCEWVCISTCTENGLKTIDSGMYKIGIELGLGLLIWLVT